MTDLISRDAVIELLLRIKAQASVAVLYETISKEMEDKVVDIVDMFAEMFQKIPAIDAVPVVRCRECKHLEKEKRQNGETDLFCGLTDLYANPDGYCECGARMDAKSEEDTDETD